MKLVALGLAAILLPGCILGCSGYSGTGDRVFARSSDQLILCANDGFIATTSAGTIEGALVQTPASVTITGVEGNDHTAIFTLDDDDSDTVETIGFGSAWTQVAENQAELDHADVLCTDLTTRAWWSAS